MITLSQQTFAHAMTAVLSCHVQNFVVIGSSKVEREQNKISVKFELWWKIISEMGVWLYCYEPLQLTFLIAYVPVAPYTKNKPKFSKATLKFQLQFT